MSQTYRVLRQFSADRVLHVGEILSLGGRNIHKLVELRYLEPVEDDADPAGVLAEAPVEAQDAQIPTKRGRGRPRKTVTTQDISEPTQAL